MYIEFFFNFDTVLYHILEKETSDRTNIGRSTPKMFRLNFRFFLQKIRNFCDTSFPFLLQTLVWDVK